MNSTLTIPLSGPFSGSKSSAKLPPASIRGAKNTKVDISLDWCAFTCPIEHFEAVQAFVAGDGAEWTTLERGGLGYTQQVVSDTTRILYGQRGEMHVICTGQSMGRLRERRVSDRDFLAFVLSIAKNVTRLDVAFDTFGNTLSLNVIKDHLERNAVVSRFKGWAETSARKLGDSRSKGRMITMGSRSSKSYVRMYDKGLETKSMPAGQWIRCELELKDENAMAAARLFVDEDIDSGAGLLASLIDFKADCEADSNKSRHPRADWWDTFLGRAQKVSLGLAVPTKTLSQVYAWIKKQVGPNLAALVEAAGGDLAVIHEILTDGQSRQRAKHRLLASSMLAPA